MAEDVTAGTGSISEGQYTGGAIEIKSAAAYCVAPADACLANMGWDAIDGSQSVINLQRPRRATC
jgi:hypothetical protein